MNLIAFTGHSGVGKDTVASILEELISIPDFCPVVIHVKTSDYIALQLARVIKADQFHMLEARSTEPKLIREILKAAGNWVREMELEYLDNLVHSTLEDYPLGTDDYFLLTGIRFPDEITTIINNYNATIIRITNPRIPIHDPSHDTVRHINDLPYHYVIPNTGTIDDLRATVTKLWNETRFSSVGRPLICPGTCGDGE